MQPSDETLRKCGLTREQVRRATAHMRQPVTALRPDEDSDEAVQDWILHMVRTWRSFALPTLAAMCRMEQLRFHRLVKTMADAGLPVAIEQLFDGKGVSTFVCLPELVSETPSTEEIL